ncbi:MAG: ATP-binding cassette domain-containing protein [Bacilli bacterium]
MNKNLSIITLKNVTKVFDGTTVVENMNLNIKKGEFVTFLGPSGCGKSTTLRMIAGFEMPTSGDILLNGEDITSIPPYKRPINTVFQRYALFPYLNVYDNVAFGLKLKKLPILKKDKTGNPILKIDKNQIKILKARIRRISKDKIMNQEDKKEYLANLNVELEEALVTPKNSYKYRKLSVDEIDEKVLKALKIVDLDELEDRDVTTLSGGQQQRVAIARAITCEPEILLLDEPLGALDLKMRKDMQLELKEMHKKLGITFIYVTHDQEEALTMSDTIIVMNDGAIQQIGTPLDIYNEPNNAFVADFIGESNIYNATMVGKLEVKFLGHVFKCVDDFPLNEKVDVVVRPEDVIISPTLPKVDCIKGVIDSKIFKGVHYQYVVMVGKNEVVVQSTKDYKEHSRVYLKISKDSIQIMKKTSTINIYTDSYISKAHKLVIDDVEFDCLLTKLIPGSTIDEDGIISFKDKKYDFVDANVVSTITPENIEITDDCENAMIKGEIINLVYVGDHYEILVRTETEEDFIINTPYTFNISDIVGLNIKAESISLRLKGEISKYEI